MTRLLHCRDTPIAGVKVIKRTLKVDERGSFARIFCAEELIQAGWLDAIAQVNLSHTSLAGTVRGLHYQIGISSEDKLISCIAGAVWDVAVDLRPSSASYLCWHAERLDPENANAMLIPKGVAHGFQALEPNSSLLYIHSRSYAPGMEAGLLADDPRLAISWPLKIRDRSERDRSFPLLDADNTVLLT
jgi:dTDP-4-dehydrorhamnose 3,5-epimerase